MNYMIFEGLEDLKEDKLPKENSQNEKEKSQNQNCKYVNNCSIFNIINIYQITKLL